MTPQWKKRLAREWLTVIMYVFIGLLLLLFVQQVFHPFRYYKSDGRCMDLALTGWLHLLFGSRYPTGWGPAYAYDATWGKVTLEDRFLVWGLLLGPYVIYQLVRSVIWAVKALRAT